MKPDRINAKGNGKAWQRPQLGRLGKMADVAAGKQTLFADGQSINGKLS